MTLATPLAEPDLDALFSALANPTRRAIVHRLVHGELQVNDLAAPFNMSLPAVSKHLTVLEDAGVISRTRRGRARFCSLHPRSLDEMTDWIASCRAHWENTLDAVASYVEDEK